VTAQEAELAERLTESERTQLMAVDEINQLRRELGSSSAQRDRFEKQANDMREEVERLARLLLDESEPIRLPAAQAA